MKIITGQFNDSYKPVVDGVANVIKNYAYWLNRKYGKSYIITPAFPQYEDDEEFEVMRYFSTVLPKRKPYRLGMPMFDVKFMKKMNSISFDIVHAHCPFSSGQLAYHLSRRRNIPVVATFHSKYYDDFKEVFKAENLTRLIVKIIVEFYNSVDYVWTVNRSTADTLKEYGFKGNIEVVYNGTDFKPVADKSGNSDIINKKLNINSDVPVFLFVGQHIWQKNLKMLVESLRELENQGIKFKMLFAGRGYAEEELKNLTGELGLNHRVDFLGQILDRKMLEALFSRADLFLFPSVYDNAPLVIREAAAAKCPSLLINDSNSSEGIVDNYNGFLSVNNPKAYAQKIIQAIGDRDALKKVGENAQNTLYVDWETIVDRIYDMYCDIIIRNRKKTAL